jgi:hypothetical protein
MTGLNPSDTAVRKAYNMLSDRDRNLLWSFVLDNAEDCVRLPRALTLTGAGAVFHKMMELAQEGRSQAPQMDAMRQGFGLIANIIQLVVDSEVYLRREYGRPYEGDFFRLRLATLSDQMGLRRDLSIDYPLRLACDAQSPGGTCEFSYPNPAPQRRHSYRR